MQPNVLRNSGEWRVGGLHDAAQVGVRDPISEQICSTPPQDKEDRKRAHQTTQNAANNKKGRARVHANELGVKTQPSGAFHATLLRDAAIKKCVIQKCKLIGGLFEQPTARTFAPPSACCRIRPSPSRAEIFLGFPRKPLGGSLHSLTPGVNPPIQGSGWASPVRHSGLGWSQGAHRRP